MTKAQMRAQIRLQLKQEVSDLKRMPKGVNPFPYIAWAWRCDFWKFMITISIILGIIIFSTSVTIKTKWFEKDKYDIVKSLKVSEKSKSQIIKLMQEENRR